MTKGLIYIGLDVDEKSYHGCAVMPDGELISFRCNPNASSFVKKLKNMEIKLNQVRVCYESTYLGFSLARALKAKRVACEVIASSLIPDLSSKKVKTDRLDAEKLAIYYKKGLLTPVYQPDQTDELVCHLLRFRKFLVEQLKGSKLRLRSEARLAGLELPKSEKWSKSYAAKLDIAIKAVGSLEVRSLLHRQLSYILAQVSELEKVEEQIVQWSTHERYCVKHDALTCLRGLSTLAAMTVITELGDVHRFAHPRQLTSYVGLDVKEYSSGGKERKYGITKMGNKRVRTTLVESNQTLPKSPRATTKLSVRRKGKDPRAIAIAEKWDERIYKKATRLLIMNKNRNKVKVACAREQIGFIWEILKTVS